MEDIIKETKRNYKKWLVIDSNNYLKKKKNMKRECARNRYCNMCEKDKQKLKESKEN